VVRSYRSGRTYLQGREATIPSPPHKAQLIALSFRIPPGKVPAKLVELHRSAGTLDALVALLGARGVQVGRSWLSQEIRAERHRQRVDEVEL
jgi:hypothetical protein